MFRIDSARSLRFPAEENIGKYTNSVIHAVITVHKSCCRQIGVGYLRENYSFGARDWKLLLGINQCFLGFWKKCLKLLKVAIDSVKLVDYCSAGTIDHTALNPLIPWFKSLICLFHADTPPPPQGGVSTY